MKERKMYFEVPTQVKFWDIDGDHYVGGIAYHDEVICGCCGGIFEISEIYDFSSEGIEPIIELGFWTDIQADILRG